MELRSGRRLGSPPQGDARRRGRPLRRRSDDDHGGGGEEEDWVSSLPTALLVQILSGLGSTREAARTGVLSTQWRGLWPELRRQSFSGVDPDTLLRLLGQVARRELDRLEIRVPAGDTGVTSGQITSLLRAAEDRSPAEFILDVRGGDGDGDGDLPFELPIFARATSMELQVWRRSFTLPAAGEFPKLDRLILSLCCVDPAGFLPRCPRLRVLNMCCYWVQNEVTIGSGSLHELVLKDAPFPNEDATPQIVNIVAPELKKFKLQSSVNRELIVSLQAPKVEELYFKYCATKCRSVGCGGYWRLLSLAMATECCGRVLSMEILADHGAYPAKRSFAQEIARLGLTDSSVLNLGLQAEGHAYGSIVLHLLETLTCIQRLQVVLQRNMVYFRYRDNEHNNQHYNWKYQQISLTNIKEIAIDGLNVASDHDMDLLELLFTSAPVLQVVRIRLIVVVSRGGCARLNAIFGANASVRCYVNGRPLKQLQNLPPDRPRRSKRMG
ncbi:hypothetical protein ACP70R_028629 [Stipagrostis hirtigluma subsp. patula]